MKCLVLMSFKGMEGWLRLSGEAQYYKGDWCGMLYKVFMGSKFIAKPLQDEFKSTKLVTVSVKRRGMFCEGHWDIFALLNKWRSNQLQIKTLIASIVKKKKKTNLHFLGKLHSSTPSITMLWQVSLSQFICLHITTLFSICHPLLYLGCIYLAGLLTSHSNCTLCENSCDTCPFSLNQKHKPVYITMHALASPCCVWLSRW